MSPRDLDRFLAANPHLRVAVSTPSRHRAVALPARARPPTRRTLRKGPTPHDLLWSAIVRLYPGAKREFKDAVPDRAFRLDIAIPGHRLAIEVDGWEWHGKHKGDFQRDRARQNLLTVNNWRILRFTAGEIRKNLPTVIVTIKTAVEGLS